MPASERAELFPAPPTCHGAGGAAAFARVALNRPLRCEFSYAVPEALRAAIRPGVRVAVPFGRRREVGVVVALDETCDLEPRRIRAVAAALDSEPLIDRDLLELTRWIAGYYACSWGEALAAVLPAALKRERGRRKVVVASAVPGVGTAELAELDERFPKQHRLLRTLLDLGAPVELADLTRRLGLSDSPARSLERRGWVRIERVESGPDELFGAPQERARPERLTGEQARAVEALERRLAEGSYATFLLHGVTGSGKTEVYLRVIERALEEGRGAIVIVPEIALTPQTVGWFRSRFGEVAVLHSRMSDAQRLDMWTRVKSGRARVVVGARSAVFAPVERLGVIVVDEEHEPSFKQGNAPRYHARDVAVVRAKGVGAVCVLGSATPSLESWHNAREGRYELLELKQRVRGEPLPPVEIVDMRGERGADRGPALFSRSLRTRLVATLERGEQAILFLNRRGFAPVLWCQACGTTVRCEQCAVSLTFHRRIQRAVCHSCCEERRPPRDCPTCSAPGLRFLGIGAERVEDELRALAPDARVRRMDSDTMLRREDYEETLAAFGRGDVDVLVGTQMIAKGLDFPRVTLVGIVSADTGLHIPDVRSAERTFQLVSQVSGRAGRGELGGHIVVQTFSPTDPSITHAARHDFEGFAQHEVRSRAALHYPPFARLLRVVLEDEDVARVLALGEPLHATLKERLTPHGVIVMPFAPAPIAKLRGRHRYNLLLKCPERGRALGAARELVIEEVAGVARPKVVIDVDPVGMG